jgi:hypothetical protein
MGGGASVGGGSASGGGSAIGGGASVGGGSASGGGTATDAGSTITPETDGAYSVVTSTQSLAVTSTRTVGLNLYVPSGVTGTPLVVLHPGFQLSASLYDSYGKHLASLGVTVIIIDPPYSFIGGPTHAELATYLGAVIDWAVALPGVDPSKLLLAGHSLGGKISLLRATTDSRVKAVFGIDPVDSIDPLSTMPSADYPSVTPELMSMITVPLALTGEITNSTCTGSFCQACAPAADNFHQYAIHAVSPSVEIQVNGASHMSFLDNPSCGLTCSVCPAGTDNPANSARLIHRYLTAFVNLELRQDASARDWLAGTQMAADVQSGQVTSTTYNSF